MRNQSFCGLQLPNANGARPPSPSACATASTLEVEHGLLRSRTSSGHVSLRQFRHATLPRRMLMARPVILRLTFRSIFRDVFTRGVTMLGLLLRCVGALSEAIVSADTMKATVRQLGENAGRHLPRATWHPSGRCASPCCGTFLVYPFPSHLPLAFAFHCFGIGGIVCSFRSSFAHPPLSFLIWCEGIPVASGTPQDELRLSSQSHSAPSSNSSKPLLRDRRSDRLPDESGEYVVTARRTTIQLLASRSDLGELTSSCLSLSG